MNRNSWQIVLVLVVGLWVTMGMTGCGRNSTSQETENLKKEIEELKKQTADEKLAKDKEELASQQDALAEEKQKLETDKKNAEAKKVQPVKNGEVFLSGQTVFIRVSSGSLKLRSRPNNSSSVLASGGNSHEVEIIEYDKTWCKVSYNGKQGFMATKFLNAHEVN